MGETLDTLMVETLASDTRNSPTSVMRDTLAVETLASGPAGIICKQLRRR
jgi:hypothetical protein